MKQALAGSAVLAVAATAAAALCLALYPFQTLVAMRRARLAGHGVRSVRAGGLTAYELDGCAAGAPCRCAALLHGLGDSALTWDNTLIGAGGAPVPPKGWRLLALNLPGTDGSDAPATPAGYAIPAQADAVRAALEGRCPKWTVAGNSLGGWVAGWLALKWPQGVERLVLVDPAGVDDPTGDAIKTARTLQDPTVEKMKVFADLASHKKRAVPERAWAAVVASIKSRPAAAMVAALRREDLLDERAKSLRLPVAVLWGASDRALPRAMGEKLARLIPGASFSLVPDCGHLPQQECPAAVSRALFE